MVDPEPSSVLEELRLDSDGDLEENDVVNKKKEITVKKSRYSLWRGQYCCVPLCCHCYGEQEERKQLFDERI